MTAFVLSTRDIALNKTKSYSHVERQETHTDHKQVQKYINKYYEEIESKVRKE